MFPNLINQEGAAEGQLRSVGARVARIRLARNLTQASLAEEAGASLRSIKRLEAGENTTLDTFFRVLKALGMGDRLSGILPDLDVRPVERVKREGHERQRASERATVAKATQWAWGEGDDE